MRPYRGMVVPGMPAATGTEHGRASPDPARRGWSRLLLFGPAAIFPGVMLAFVIGLGRDPSVLPSPLIGQSGPEFTLPPRQGRSLALAARDLKGASVGNA